MVDRYRCPDCGELPDGLNLYRHMLWCKGKKMTYYDDCAYDSDNDTIREARQSIASTMEQLSQWWSA